MTLEEQYILLRTGSQRLALQTAQQKNAVLEAVAQTLDKRRSEILKANQQDIQVSRANGTKESLIDRLMLDDKRIDGIISSLRIVIAQTDPVGEEVAGWKTPNGLTIRQVRVPLGVMAIIYESRPNVTVDAFCLAYKSGNAILLRGSSSAYNSNKAIVKIIKDALSKVEGGVPEAIELVEVKEHDHSDVDEILNAVGKIDVVLPRGGKRLIQNVVSNARIPVIETGSGVCHLYVDEFADLLVCSAKREGMVAFVKEDKAMYTCDGDAWRVAGSISEVINPVDTMAQHVADSILAAMFKSSSSMTIPSLYSSSSVGKSLRGIVLSLPVMKSCSINASPLLE